MLKIFIQERKYVPYKFSFFTWIEFFKIFLGIYIYIFLYYASKQNIIKSFSYALNDPKFRKKLKNI